MCKDARFADWRGGCCEIVGCGEPFVAEGEDPGAEWFGDEV
jgi:hypothetical protein